MDKLSSRKKTIFWFFVAPFIFAAGGFGGKWLLGGNSNFHDSHLETIRQNTDLPAQIPNLHSDRYIDTSKYPYQNIVREASNYLTSCFNSDSHSLDKCLDQQDEFIREYINAYSGDYLAESHVSTMFVEPLWGGVVTNSVQGCAWRLVMMRSGSPYLNDLDRDITEYRCKLAGGMRDDAPVNRANEIGKVIHSHRIHPIAVPQMQYDPQRDKDEQTAGD